jgi:orotate phosphoribosyltransferase
MDSKATLSDENLDWEILLSQRQVTWQYPGHGPHAAYSLWDKHSDFYFNSDYLVCNPSLLKEAAKALFHALKQKSAKKPDWVITYPPFGLNIAFCLADLLQCKFGYIKSLEEPELNFDIRPNNSVLFCADDLHTGNSFRKVLSAVQKADATIIQPLAVVANFSGTSRFEGYEVEALFCKNINIWNAAECPLCATGSEPLPARRNWQNFTAVVDD